MSLPFSSYFSLRSFPAVLINCSCCLKLISVPNQHGLIRQAGFIRQGVAGVGKLACAISIAKLTIAPFEKHSTECFSVRVVVQVPDGLPLRVYGIHRALRLTSAVTLSKSILRPCVPRLAPLKSSYNFGISKPATVKPV